MNRAGRILVIVTVVATLLFAGNFLRGRLGLELSPDALRDWVSDLGWYGPMMFVVLLGLRTFVVLPSSVILSAGGLVFGVLVGTLLGTVGVFLSAAVQFLIARGVRRSGRARDASGSEQPPERRTIVGAFGVSAVTAHPLGPMTPVHFGAGLSSMPAATFFAAVILAAPFRAFGYSYFGTSIADIGSTQFYAATTLLGLMIVLPLLHARTRRRIFAGKER